LIVFRRKAVLAAGLVACGVVALYSLGAHAARPASVEGSIEPVAKPIVSSMGGTIGKVFVHRGDHVIAGQLLLAFEAPELDKRLARVRSVLREIPPQFLDATASLIRRIPPSTMARLVRSNPEILAAEQEYASALAETERTSSPATRERLKRSEEQRKQAYENQGGLRLDRLSALHNLHDEGLDTLHWLESQRARFEVHAPAEGQIELLDLEAGAVVPPMAPLALLDVGGQFVVRARVPEKVNPRQRIVVELPGGIRVAAVVDSFENHQLRASLAIPSRAPAPGSKVEVFF
jgi:multidrug resistance efflux pump